MVTRLIDSPAFAAADHAGLAIRGRTTIFAALARFRGGITRTGDVFDLARRYRHATSSNLIEEAKG
jgi:hypothetical protein